MNNTNMNMPCPICNTTIQFDTKELVMGTTFNCPNPQCDASIGLSTQSKSTVEDTIEKFEKIKKDALEGED